MKYKVHYVQVKLWYLDFLNARIIISIRRAF